VSGGLAGGLVARCLLNHAQGKTKANVLAVCSYRLLAALLAASRFAAQRFRIASAKRLRPAGVIRRAAFFLDEAARFSAQYRRIASICRFLPSVTPGWVCEGIEFGPWPSLPRSAVMAVSSAFLRCSRFAMTLSISLI
jgi:hypothetical protein